MQKKLLSTTALLIAAGIAAPSFAQWTISAGVQATELQVNTESVIRGGDTTFEGVASDENIGVGGELALGYQYNFNKTYNVAFEVFGQLAATETEAPILAEFSTVISDNEALASFDWIAGLRVRPGYFVTPKTRLFIDGGVVWGGFEVSYDDEAVVFVGSDTILDHYKDSETLVGWRYGAGIEHKFTPNFVMGIDYTITQFEEYTSDAIEDTAELVGEPGVYSTEYSPTLHTAGLNFKYLFGTKKQSKRYKMIDK